MKDKKEKKNKEKKHGIWRDILEVIIAFAVAWLVYQGIALGTGTSMPIVSVVSHSMYHDNAFDAWWQVNENFYSKYNITKDVFETFPMSNGLSRGDLIIVVNDKPKIGDIIIYNKFQGFTIVHRVIEIQDSFYITKGDNNAVADSSPVLKEQFVGRAVFAIPLLGYPRLALFAIGI